jgi:CopA family copper-resistance protein
MKNLLVFLLITVTGLYAQNDPKATQTYVCPMHPEVTSNQPGRCPKCGMPLVLKKPASAPKPAAKPATVPRQKPTSRPKKVAAESESKSNHQEHSVKVDPVEEKREEPAKGKSAYIPKRIRYDLYVADTLVNYTGKNKRAIAINGSIPSPTLVFTQGDTAEIHVHNKLKESTAMHWHGVFLPNRMDGVPYLTQMPINPGETYVYEFEVKQNGTYWYHSHAGLQEQIGMYGALIFKKPEEDPVPSIPVVISEWTDMRPNEVLRRLRMGSDWFGVRKNTIQSYGEAIRAGHLKTKLVNEWKRMHAMDVSDVDYDAFLVNGLTSREFNLFKAGDKVRLRVINGGASSYFWLSYAGGKMTVVANDGNDVEPVEVDRLIVGTAETYDVIVSIPQNMSYEFLVTPEDRTKHASVWLGSGMKMPAPKLPKLKYFEGMKMMNAMMDNQGNMKSMGMDMSNQTMDMNVVMYPEVTGEAVSDQNDAHQNHQEHEDNKGHAGHQQPLSGPVTLNYAMLRSPHNTDLSAPGEFRELQFELNGNMNRYVWTLDNKTVAESDRILIKKGEKVRITLFNNSMMRHPMHLHGHDFRLINGQLEHAPLKNTVDVMPMETNVIEYEANEEGDWFFHCHILYHMMTGMGRIMQHERPAQTNIQNPHHAKQHLLKHHGNMVHFMAENDFATNGNDGFALLAGTRWQLNTEWRLGYSDRRGYEVETHFGYLIGKNQWLMPFIGLDWRYRKNGLEPHEENLFGQQNTKDKRIAITAGVEYLLPMLVTVAAEVYTDGNLRLTLRRDDIPLTRRLRMGLMANSDKEYMAGFRYIISRYFAPSVHYDSDMGLGVGMTVTY